MTKMPRSKPVKDDAAPAEPRKRSRTGCWPCKARKVKCGEEKPKCSNCTKYDSACDYRIRLNWGGRAQKDRHSFSSATSTAPSKDIFVSAQNAINPAFSALQHAIESPTFSVIQPSSPELPPPPYTHSPIGRPRSHAGSSSSPHLSHHRDSFGSTTSFPDSSPRIESLGSGRHSFVGRHLPHITQLDTTHYDHVNSPLATAPLSNSFENRALAGTSQYASVALSERQHKRARTSIDMPKSFLGSSPQDDARRLSVKSLLDGPPDADRLSASIARAMNARLLEDGTRLYGYDYGFPDLDIPRNNDTLVIAPQPSPKLNEQRQDLFSKSGTATPQPAGHMAFESGGYYASPVQIKISSIFEPLPRELTSNPMNLLYFHHFLNHTARVLVPYDCDDNPLRWVMPEMAVRNPSLLNLLLAYSASHRAQLLNHKEPANRIALWMRDAFPSLRAALSSSAPITDASLATAVLLCSLKIVSPNTFDVPLTWQDYLSTARQIIVSRGGLAQLAREGDKYVDFCVKWYCYLEVCGGLSGTTQEPLSGEYYAYGEEFDGQNYSVDCFLGFTNRGMGLMAKVAKLARQCDRERQKGSWHIDDHRVQEALRLRDALIQSRDHMANKCCEHVAPNKQDREMQELLTSNKMYHWAALIHLYRRVLGKSSADPDVQDCVDSILSEWLRIRKGSTYESCLLLPLFTAGCDTLDQARRNAITERLQAVEGWGLPHFLKARLLMQKSWETGRPWETLVVGEFFG